MLNRIFNMFLMVAVSAVLVGCSQDKSVKKGTDEKVVVQTKAADGLPATVKNPASTGPGKTTTPGK